MGTYAQTVTAELDWLAGLPRDLFDERPHVGDFIEDYASEDGYLQQFPGLLARR